MSGWSISQTDRRGERHRLRPMNGRQTLTVCDRCRQSFSVEQIKQEWTGLFVCDETANGCWEPMHPMLKFQAPVDNSLFRSNPRDLPYDFTTPPAPSGNPTQPTPTPSIANDLRKSQGNGQ